MGTSSAMLPKIFVKEGKNLALKACQLKTTVVATIISNDVGRIPTYQMYRREMNEIILPFPSFPDNCSRGRGVVGGRVWVVVVKILFRYIKAFCR